jgi:hypothetical protein
MTERAIDIIAEVVRNGSAVRPYDAITRPMWRAFRALRRAGEITWYFLGPSSYVAGSVSGTMNTGQAGSVSGTMNTGQTISTTLAISTQSVDTIIYG